MPESSIVVTSAEKGLANIQQGASAIVDKGAATVKKSNLTTLRAVLSAGKFGGITNRSYQTLPRPLAAGCLLIGGGYALCKIIPGPLSMTI